MNRDANLWLPKEGMDVVGADNDKVGEVDSVTADHFVVQKGFFFPEDHYIPMSAVASYDDERIYLNVTKDQALEQQWNTPPVATDGAATTGVVDADYDDTDRRADADRTVSDDHANIAVHEEELVAQRRTVDEGDVRVTKNVVQEEESIEVPVTEEHVNVTRRDVDRDVAADDGAFEEGTIEIPVHGEEVDIEKRARVTEEIDIDKTSEQRTERVTDTVRREEVDIDGVEVEKDRR